MTQRKEVDPVAFAAAWADRTMNLQDIGDRFGISPSTVALTGDRLGLPARMRAHRKFGVTAKQREVAERLARNGCTLLQISQRAGVSMSAASRIALQARGKINTPSRPEQTVDKPPAEEPRPDMSSITGRLIASKGRYVDLARIAEQERMTLAGVQQAYHRARSSHV